MNEVRRSEPAPPSLHDARVVLFGPLPEEGCNTPGLRIAEEWWLSVFDMATCHPLYEDEATDIAQRMRAIGFTEEEITSALASYAIGNCDNPTHGHPSEGLWKGLK